MCHPARRIDGVVLEGQEGKVAGYLLEDSPVHRVVELPSLDPAF